MNYDETLHYLYHSTPVFHQIGAAAYKPGLDNTKALDHLLAHPHRSFKSIHVGGTNGKGSTSHLIAATLQSAGYKVGLYTSPHLIDFRERIRVDGIMIPKEEVVEFVDRFKSQFELIQPSFFELTFCMAMHYFALQKIDFAVIEVGLGGRLDSTNIINPELSIITNISLDHIQFLGNTLPKIATEKAGIIKQNIPVVIGQSKDEVRKVFLDKAIELNSHIRFADDERPLQNFILHNARLSGNTKSGEKIDSPLGGQCQIANAQTVLTAIDQLRSIGLKISKEAVENGFREVIKLTGLRGRWEVIAHAPFTVCDTGHNEEGILQIVQQLQNIDYNTLHIVFGMVNDKEIDHILQLLPSKANYYFTQASVERALPAEQIAQKAASIGLKGTHFPDVITALQAAQKKALPADAIYVGGSTFIVADLLSHIRE